ncbi:uncharacterized protein LOC111478714 [Cucurbita maxima]|uniref:Uncharacterized protein LOC111478714 n=1 Tax=Cucurbita maxima TaxID=3661 RepID=A0A6J1IUL1_CUCMA|nr:uncharacterized protein LOC111478714 [Cucurbita maxima]XP_022978901.1 uncharacterized protein LOC111478714 [Cucurbita maxima]XP_022978902.1 uncharacterized protein LOC111478714 [Cucurbita maxima]XP_022978903.1 uncharacterized protein LOC111478714 [Cucurbita maxima]
MEKLPKAHEKEYMRMAMLKHEETFKQQVHELHRLYRTQKTLMKNVEKSRDSGWNTKSWDKRNEICFRQIYEQDAKNYSRSTTQTTKLDLEQPAEDEAEANNGALQIINENELELTLGPSSYNTSDSGITTHSSSSTGSSHEGRRMDRNQVRVQEMAVLGVPENPSGFQNGSDRGEKKMVEVDYPPWLFQAVSLNLT